MDLYVWLFWILEIPLAWFLWTVAHEGSHVLTAQAVSNLTDIKWWLYPHRDESGNFYFAKVQWSWDPSKVSELQNAAVYLAPRVMNTVASIMLPLAFLLPISWMVAWIIFWGAGIIDFIVGSLGISEYSDLRRSASYLKINPNTLRIIGFALIIFSITLCFTFIGLRYAS